MKRICFVIFFLLRNSTCFSQNTFLESFYTAGTAQNMFGKKTSDSGYLLYGFNYFTGNNLFTKTDSNGVIVFSKYYNMPSNCLINGAFEKQNGYTLVCFNTTGDFFYTLNTDSSGNFIAGRSYFSTQDISFNFLGQIGFDIYFSGWIGPNSAIMKMDTSGTIRWVKEYNTTSGSGFGIGAISKNNEIYLTGTIQIPFNSITSVVKLDTAGNIKWSKQLQLYNRFELGTTDESGIIISMSNLAIKFDSAGTIEWSKFYNVDTAHSLITMGIKSTLDHGYILGGNYTSNNSGYPEPAFLLHIDLTGTPNWIKTYGTLNRQEVGSCEVTSDSGYVVVGTSIGFTSTSTDKGFMLKTDISGNLGCFDNQVSVTDSSSNIIDSPVTFTSSNSLISDTALPFIPIVTDQPSSFICSSITNILPLKFTQIQLYPNPIYNKASISVSDESKFSFTVFNTFGEINFKSTINSFETELDFSNLPNGIYFYQLSNSENNFTGKFIVAH